MWGAPWALRIGRVHVRDSIVVRCAALLVGLGLVPACAWAQVTVSIGPTADNTMYSESPNNSNGQGPGLFTGATSSGGLRRALLAFDLSSIPAHAPIASASVTLFMDKTVSGPSGVSAHRVREAWGEGASNAGDPGGGGTLGAPGDATWDFAFYNSTAWSTPGGEFAASPSATLAVDQAAFYVWSSAGLAADVQAWVDAPHENHGWVMVGAESALTTAKRFVSRNGQISARRPLLVVEYYCPGDFDQNGFVNGEDFDSFVAFFEIGDPAADWDRNSFVNGDDFDGFVAAFAGGC